MKQDFDELSNLLIENKNKKYQIGRSLMSMYDHCDNFNPNSNSSITDEENLSSLQNTFIIRNRYYKNRSYRRCEKSIRVEVGSAADKIQDRPVFYHLIYDELKENDLLLVTKIDRCIRNKPEFLELEKKDAEAFDMLLHFLATIEENLNYSEKQTYLELAKDFLANQIAADDFSYTFMGIYERITRKLAEMEKEESLELADFFKPRRRELGYFLARIYGSCDSFSPDPEVEIVISDEKELKDCAQILLVKLQEE